MRSMDSILSDEPSVHTLPDGPQSDSAPADSAAKEEAVKGETPEKVETEAGTKPTETVEHDDPEESDPDPTDYSVTGLRKALSAVRGDKRKMRKSWQEAERKIAQLEGQIAAISQMGARNQEQPKAEPKPEPEKVDFYGNPEGYVGNTAKTVAEQVAAKIVADQLDERLFRERAIDSEEAMREQHPEDYEAAKTAFVKAAEKAPWLWQAVRADRRPAAVVYREGKKILGGDSGDDVAQLKAEIAALKAGQTGAAPKPAKAIPKPSNASARGSGSSVKKEWSGPRTMEEILARGH